MRKHAILYLRISLFYYVQRHAGHNTTRRGDFQPPMVISLHHFRKKPHHLTLPDKKSEPAEGL